ncbi:UDP-glucose 4-epimerase GalE [Promicromonospora thailandica]|uniref:UDP-glucose 4-epimerase n=1 Tax=Promicromonospora thailandica TaxID=765201 RepID=A0A9X2G477_9MICO|nr:UDP-glucose 4-epimerase GalE [Promicromonospora thailandica]MCP2265373.1 UDP-glucose 4-epimerase [Promicromonospora thailandica]BFF16908.1 UDP-glucose 4-epimerase GalE [Promicromonospora thailandica]
MRVLVSGGAGYIGSHTVLALVAAGHDVLVVDDFSNSKPTVQGRLEAIAGRAIPFHAFDLTDVDKTERLFAHEQIDAVVHFAGFKAVGESVTKPLEYYRNNLDSTFALAAAMAKHGVTRLVFSSSATVYGEKAPVPYQEDYEHLSSSSPYGQTKVMIERVLSDVAHISEGWKVALLRYFNPVGAHESGDIGEDPQGVPNNLMPFIAQVAVGRREKLTVFGGDYPTADGTAERDYLHVTDLAAGHVAALEHLDDMAEPARAFNLGTGTGTSVLQLLKAFERAVGRELPYEIGPRRSGDLPAFWADPTRAHTELGWRATKTIDDMCADTWRWQSRNPQGFPDA